jgi:hypothetical protein
MATKKETSSRATVPKARKYVWTEEELDTLRENYGDVSMMELQKMIPNKTLQGLKRKARMLGLVTDEKKESTKYYTHCDMCGDPLPQEEIVIGVANHRDCWKKWVTEQRKRNPVTDEDGENFF